MGKLSIMLELQNGLLQNEFEIVYQPQIHLASQKVIGVESLIRWHHPSKGSLPPSCFIPLAEETGYIKKLTHWLLAKVFQQCAYWQKKQVYLKTAINLSAKDLLNEHLFSDVAFLLSQYNINPKWITFEMTESVFMHSPENTLSAIQKLSQLGIQFSIDDFGIGYSSFHYLKNIQLNELKIDKSFINDMTTNKRAAQLVYSMIAMGHNLNMTIIAEGIENIQTYDKLIEFECDIGQGYLFSPPISAANFLDWLQTFH